MQDITEVLVVLGVVLACFVVRYIVQWWYLAYRRKLEVRNSPQTSNPYIMESGNTVGTNSPPPEFDFAVKHSAHVSYIQMDESPPSYAEYENSFGKDLPQVHISIAPENKIDKINGG